MARTKPPAEPVVTYGALIRAARVRSGQTQADLAERADIDLSLLIRIEKGQHDNFGIKVLERIARALGMEPIELMPSTHGSVARRAS